MSVQEAILKLTKTIRKRCHDIDRIAKDPDDLNDPQEQKVILVNTTTIILKSNNIKSLINGKEISATDDEQDKSPLGSTADSQSRQISNLMEKLKGVKEQRDQARIELADFKARDRLNLEKIQDMKNKIKKLEKRLKGEGKAVNNFFATTDKAVLGSQGNLFNAPGVAEDDKSRRKSFQPKSLKSGRKESFQQSDNQKGYSNTSRLQSESKTQRSKSRKNVLNFRGLQKKIENSNPLSRSRMIPNHPPGQNFNQYNSLNLNPLNNVIGGTQLATPLNNLLHQSRHVPTALNINTNNNTMFNSRIGGLGDPKTPNNANLGNMAQIQGQSGQAMNNVSQARNQIRQQTYFNSNNNQTAGGGVQVVPIPNRRNNLLTKSRYNSPNPLERTSATPMEKPSQMNLAEHSNQKRNTSQRPSGLNKVQITSSRNMFGSSRGHSRVSPYTSQRTSNMPRNDKSPVLEFGKGGRVEEVSNLNPITMEKQVIKGSVRGGMRRSNMLKPVGQDGNGAMKSSGVGASQLNNAKNGFNSTRNQNDRVGGGINFSKDFEKNLKNLRGKDSSTIMKSSLMFNNTGKNLQNLQNFGNQVNSFNSKNINQKSQGFALGLPGQQNVSGNVLNQANNLTKGQISSNKWNVLKRGLKTNLGQGRAQNQFNTEPSDNNTQKNEISALSDQISESIDQKTPDQIKEEKRRKNHKEYAKKHVHPEASSVLSMNIILHPKINHLLAQLGPLKYPKTSPHVDLKAPHIGPHKIKDGSYYEGHWKNHKPHGRGVWVSSSGVEFFEGEFKFGKRNGYGRCVEFDGTVKEGPWVNSWFQGKEQRYVYQ